MNAVEIEQAVSELADQPFDAAEFPYAFLMAFGNKETTIKRLRTGASNKSDIGASTASVKAALSCVLIGLIPQVRVARLI